MSRRRPNVFYLLPPGLMAILGVGLWQLRPASEIEQERSSTTEVELPSRRAVASLGSSAPLGFDHSVPRLAAGIDFDSSGSSEDEGVPRTSREDFLKNERMLMAQTWGFDDEQYERFERAARRNGRQERREVFEQMQRGEFPGDELGKRLAEADEKDSRELREVLGSRLEEYETMQGHFEEAGLLNRPFEAPVMTERPDRP